MQGSADWRVLPEEALELADTLYKLKQPLRFVLLEGGQHNLYEHYDEVNSLSKQFLNMYVRNKKQWPDLEPHGK